MKPPPLLTYNDIYRNLDGMTALATAAATPLRRQKDEKDTRVRKADRGDIHEAGERCRRAPLIQMFGIPPQADLSEQR